MNKRQISILILPGLVIAIFFLLVKSADNGIRKYSLTEQAVRKINQRNRELDTAVLALRLGLVHDYDELMQAEQAFASEDAALSNTETDVTNLAKLKLLVQSKIERTTDFKANHAVVRNAIAGFCHHIDTAQKLLTGETNQHSKFLARLETLGSRFALSGDPTDKSKFESAIANGEQALPFGDGQNSELNQSASRALNHAKRLVASRMELDESIATLVELPIELATAKILDSAEIQHRAKSSIANRYRLGLSISILGLIGFCLIQFFALLKHKAEIHQSNVMLEHRVAERTQELATTNIELEQTIAEVEKLALLARYTDNAVVITDANACIEWINDGFTRITGYLLEEVVGQRRCDLLHGEKSNPLQLEKMATAVKEKRGFDIEILNYKKNGEPFWVAIETRPILAHDGAIARFIAIESDITHRIEADLERQRLNEQLVAASRSAGMADVATGVLHNVGNILNSVNVSASLINKQFEHSALSNLNRIAGLIEEHEADFADYVKDDARGKMIPRYILKVTESIKAERQQIGDEFSDLLKNVEHIKQIVSVQQSMAKASGIRQELSPELLIDDAITANKSTLTNHQVEVTREIAESLPDLISDKHKILQVLINLIKNAIEALVEHSTERPQIIVRSYSRNRNVIFEVSDNGIGISAENLDKVFQHGFTTKRNGHGFGLHSSANAATELGGCLTVSSDGIGFGTCFGLEIPVGIDARQEMADAYTLTCDGLQNAW